MCARSINLSLSESLLMASRMVSMAVGACGLGDLLSLCLKEDELGGESSTYRYINFTGNTQLLAQPVVAITGQVNLLLDQSIGRWVPAVVRLNTNDGPRAIDFGYWFGSDNSLELDTVEATIVPGSRPISSEASSLEPSQGV